MPPSFWEWVDAHDAFQDVPFSNTWLLPQLYARYADALYILTVRDPEDWFESLVKFHCKIFGLQRDANTAEIARSLKANTYITPGYLYRTHIRQYGITGDDKFYNRDQYIQNYRYHNDLVRRTIPADQLLEIEIAKYTDTFLICQFLKTPVPQFMRRKMPWMNQRK